MQVMFNFFNNFNQNGQGFVYDCQAERITYYQAPNPQNRSTIIKQSSSAHGPNSDSEQARRDKDMQKNLALLAKYFKKIYKPTNNNLLELLQTLEQDWMDTTPRYNKTISAGLGNICDGMQEAKAGFKITRFTKEKMIDVANKLNKVQNHDENDVFANVRRHSEQPESINDTYVLEKDDSNVIPDSSNICTNDNQVDQNAAECVDERVALANLIENLTLDTEENKTILKQLKKANASLT
ncbi:hypothetical protein Tco_0251993 [Tanacetum coccineum]